MYGREEDRVSGPGAPPDAQGAEPPRATVYLHGGQIHATAERAQLSTVLGSCISVCLFDPVAKVGGMNHYLLPRAGGREATPRFGDVANPALLNAVLKAGARPDRLRAFVFGGGCVLEAFRNGRRSLGDDNADLALEFLQANRIPIDQSDLGGPRGRKLVFLVDAASATSKLL